MVLDHLVLHNAHAGLRNRGLRQRDACLVGRCRCGKKNTVDLLLRKAGIDSLCFFDAVDLLLQFIDRVDKRILSFHTVRLLNSSIK